MDLTVEHRTTYRFEAPRQRVVQSLRLTPVDTAAQTVRRWTVSAEGATIGAAFTDGAGNPVATMTLPGPVEAVTVAVSGAVTTTDTAGVLRGQREVAAPDVYLRSTRRTAPGVGLQALADKLGPAGDRTLDMAHAIADLVADEIVYQPGATDADMTALEVAELGRGVCQDQAQVLIAVARLRGIPARYVSGYLYAPDLDTDEAGHAWAELYIKDLGWVGFDPANRCCPDARYIRVSSGLDALGAAPIRGVALGTGAETLDIQVRVASQSQQ